jgi:hypothetical protein
MKSEKVRCWEIRKGVLITYPEGNLGHELITCLRCGLIYSVNVPRKIYVGPPIEDRLKGLHCMKCGSSLLTTWAYYPEKHLNEHGEITEMKRPEEIPPENQSMVVEFPELYSD